MKIMEEYKIRIIKNFFFLIFNRKLSWEFFFFFEIKLIFIHSKSTTRVYALYIIDRATGREKKIWKKKLNKTSSKISICYVEKKFFFF